MEPEDTMPAAFTETQMKIHMPPRWPIDWHTAS